VHRHAQRRQQRHAVRVRALRTIHNLACHCWQYDVSLAISRIVQFDDEKWRAATELGGENRSKSYSEGGDDASKHAKKGRGRGGGRKETL